MASLSAHLRRPEQHARLPFHHECPICREERLVGTLAAASLISPRGRAALATGVLAVSAVAPPVTIAQEPDQTREGVAAPDALSGDRVHSPDFDPGGPTIEVPAEPAPSPDAAVSEDAADADGPVEQELGTDTEALIVDPGDQAAGPGTSPSPSDVAPQPPVELPAAPEAPQAVPGPPAAAQGPETAPSLPGGKPDESVTAERRRHGADKRDSGPRREHQGSVGEQSPASQPSTPRWSSSSTPPAARESDVEPVVADTTPEAVQPGAATASGASAQTTAYDRIGPADRTYVVRAGDSLWSIAGDRLGGEASVAAVAREVNRLWALNRDRIATGDPDLLMVGTRLTLQ